MVVSNIFTLIFINALSSKKDFNIFNARNSILSLISAMLIIYFNCYTTFLNKGISLYGGSFNLTSSTQYFLFFILFLTSIILIYNSFYHRILISNETSGIQHIYNRKYKYGLIFLGDHNFNFVDNEKRRNINLLICSIVLFLGLAMNISFFCLLLVLGFITLLSHYENIDCWLISHIISLGVSFFIYKFEPAHIYYCIPGIIRLLLFSLLTTAKSGKSLLSIWYYLWLITFSIVWFYLVGYIFAALCLYYISTFPDYVLDYNHFSLNGDRNVLMFGPKRLGPEELNVLWQERLNNVVPKAGEYVYKSRYNETIESFAYQLNGWKTHYMQVGNQEKVHFIVLTQEYDNFLKPSTVRQRLDSKFDKNILVTPSMEARLINFKDALQTLHGNINVSVSEDMLNRTNQKISEINAFQMNIYNDLPASQRMPTRTRGLPIKDLPRLRNWDSK